MPFVARSSSFFRLEGDFVTGGQEEDKSLGERRWAVGELGWGGAQRARRVNSVQRQKIYGLNGDSEVR